MPGVGLLMLSCDSQKHQHSFPIAVVLVQTVLLYLERLTLSMTRKNTTLVATKMLLQLPWQCYSYNSFNLLKQLKKLRVWWQMLKSSHRNRFLHVLLIEQRMIDAQDNPIEQGTVQRLSHGVPCCDRLKNGGEENQKNPKLLALNLWRF